MEGSSKRGRPLGRWKGRVKEYMCERGISRAGIVEQAHRGSISVERSGSSFAMATLSRCVWKERDIRVIDGENRIKYHSSLFHAF